MRTELERLFAGLAEDAGRARLAPAAEIRRRADRRWRIRAAAGAAVSAAMVAVLPVAIATAPAGPAPAPAPSPSPAIPLLDELGRQFPWFLLDRLGAEAFLQRRDALGEVVEGPANVWDPWDDHCHRGTPPGPGGLFGRGMAWKLTYRAPGMPATATVWELIMIYPPSVMADVMRSVRDRPSDCRFQHNFRDVDLRLRRLGPLGVGDDSELVEFTDVASGQVSYQAVVRIGETVTYLDVIGGGSASARRGDAVHFARRAAERVRAWRY